MEEFVASSGRHEQEHEVRRVVGLMRDYGSVEFATSYAARIAETARQAFDDAFGGCADSPALAFLRALVPFMIQRRS